MNLKNRKKAGIIAAGLAVLLVLCAVMLFGGRKEAGVQQGNLLENADFSAVTNGMPDGWQTGMWVTSAGASYLEAATMEDGTSAVLVENVAANDARFEQTVAVRENATYKLTARAMAEGCDPAQIGANVSFLGVFGTSEDVHDTNGAWEELTLYAQTGKGQKSATVCLRLGGYGSEATGRAWFTDVRLEQVEDAPVGAQVIDLTTPEPQKAETPRTLAAATPAVPAAAPFKNLRREISFFAINTFLLLCYLPEGQIAKPVSQWIKCRRGRRSRPGSSCRCCGRIPGRGTPPCRRTRPSWV